MKCDFLKMCFPQIFPQAFAFHKFNLCRYTAVEVFGDDTFTFAYVPGHLHQMLFELVKNSLRAAGFRHLSP
jgi:hypothetical protein